MFVEFAYCIQTVEVIVKYLSRPGSHIILVFLIPSADIQFQGEPIQPGVKYTGVGKASFISEMARDKLMVAMER